MVTSPKSVPKVALDTNMIIDLAKLHFNKHNPTTLPNKLKSHFQTLKIYQRLIANGDIDVIILPTVLEEVNVLSENFAHQPYQYLFKTNNNFYMFEASSAEELQSFAQNVEDLSRQYCKKIEETQEDTRSRRYFAYVKNKSIGLKNAHEPLFVPYTNHTPSLDARIMAESSIFGLNLITHDSDFTCGNLALRIQAFNQAFIENKARPYTPEDFLRKLYKKPTMEVRSKSFQESVVFACERG